MEGGEEVKEDGGSDLYIQTFAQMMTMVIKDRVKIKPIMLNYIFSVWRAEYFTSLRNDYSSPLDAET